MFAPGTYRVAVDLLRVRDAAGAVLATLSWGDRLTVTGADEGGIDVDIGRAGRVKKPAKDALVLDGAAGVPRILKLDFVDVQQGDAAVLETADGATMLVDGGQNQLFARYLAARFRGTTATAPKHIDCIVVSHGDADHFAGLTRIQKDEVASSKKVFLAPERIFHNGLVKSGGSPAFGATTTVGGRKLITDLHDDLRPLPNSRMSKGFRDWRDAINVWATRGPLTMKRLQRGDDGEFAFFGGHGVTVQVLGPVTVPVSSGVVGLPQLSSSSHTINGHSVVLLVRFGDIRFLLAGDLNEEIERLLVADHDAGLLDLRAEVLKVPHHGSADYSPEFLARVAPAVSVISSGDESERVEYVHPRATLLGALGRYSRPDLAEPVIFVTELVAFFKARGFEGGTFKFERDAFGIVRCRTDGRRLLVYTDTAKEDMNEAYAFSVKAGVLVPSKVRIVQ